MKMAESSSASASASAAAGSNVLDLELGGVDSESSFDDQCQCIVICLSV